MFRSIFVVIAETLCTSSYSRLVKVKPKAWKKKSAEIVAKLTPFFISWMKSLLGANKTIYSGWNFWVLLAEKTHHHFSKCAQARLQVTTWAWQKGLLCTFAFFPQWSLEKRLRVLPLWKMTQSTVLLNNLDCLHCTMSSSGSRLLSCAWVPCKFAPSQRWHWKSNREIQEMLQEANELCLGPLRR